MSPDMNFAGRKEEHKKEERVIAAILSYRVGDRFTPEDIAGKAKIGDPEARVYLNDIQEENHTSGMRVHPEMAIKKIGKGAYERTQ